MMIMSESSLHAFALTKSLHLRRRNRQFPSNFKPGGPMDFGRLDDDGGPPGAGPYPMYLPEGRFVAEAICERCVSQSRMRSLSIQPGMR